MNFSNKNIRTGITGIALASSLMLAGCTDGMDYSELRVIHASKDAPPVNVRVGKKTTISELDYAESSAYVSVRSGTRKLAVEAILPGDNANVIEVKRFSFEPDQRYNVLAINNTADIEPLVVAESAAEPSIDQVAIAVVHASVDAEQVDVYVTEPDTLLNSVEPDFSFNYTDVVDAGALPAATYRIRVTGPDSKEVVYDSGEVDLSGFGGEKLLLAAISSENEAEAAGSPIKLLAASDNISLVILDQDTGSGARVAHLSPDAGTVEVFATSEALGDDPVELIPMFAYTEVVPGVDHYVGVPASDYDFAVAPNTDTIGDAVFSTEEPLTLDPGIEYTVIAAGNVGGAPDFGLLATADDNRIIITQASVKVVHAAPLAGAVDVYVTSSEKDFTAEEVIGGMAGDPLLPGFEFGTITPYVPLEPGKYDIRVIAGGAAAIDIEDFELPPGLVGTVIARQPETGNDTDSFGVVVVTNKPPVIEVAEESDDDDSEDDDSDDDSDD